MDLLKKLELRLMDFAFKKGVSQTTEILKRFEDVFSEENVSNDFDTFKNDLIDCLRRYRKIVIGCRPPIMPLVRSMNALYEEIENNSNNGHCAKDLMIVAKNKCIELREKMEKDNKNAVNSLLGLLKEGVICVLDSGSNLIDAFLKDPRIDWKGLFKTILPRGVMGYRLTGDELNISFGERRIVFLGAHTLTESGGVIAVKGSYVLASLAYKKNIPLYIVATLNKVSFCSEKLLKEMIEAEPIANFYYDLIPSEFITKIATEKGIYSPYEIKNVYLNFKDTLL